MPNVMYDKMLSYSSSSYALDIPKILPHGFKERVPILTSVALSEFGLIWDHSSGQIERRTCHPAWLVRGRKDKRIGKLRERS